MKNLSFDLRDAHSIRTLLLYAGVLHVALAAAIFLLGHFQVFPAAINEHGIIPNLAADSMNYQPQCKETAALIHEGNFQFLGIRNFDFHLKLFSFAFAIFGGLFGYNILAAEPLNLIYFLTIIYLVYKITGLLFGQKAARIAFVLAALWPSHLLFTTQLQRDPLFITAMLLFIYGWLQFIKRRLAWIDVPRYVCQIFYGFLGTWLTRPDMWEMMMLFSAIAAVFCIVRFYFISPRLAAAGLIAAIALGAMLVFIPQGFGFVRRHTDITLYNSRLDDGTLSYPERLLAKLNAIRQNFMRVGKNAGTNIDGDVEIKTFGDAARFFPRAVQIGFFAPFPNMWFERATQTGSGSRLAAGIEMFVFYLLEVFALFCLWKNRRELAAWFLAAIIFTGVTILGYTIVNAGSLYRTRYAFFMMVIVLGAGAIGKVAKLPEAVELQKVSTQE